MTTSIPLVKESGETKQLPSGSKLGGIAGGAATGEAMTQDQFGTNYNQLGSGGAPTLSLASCTGLPVSTGISGFGANVAAWLASPTSSNLAAAVTGETGSGALVFGTSPTMTDATINQAANGDTAIKSIRFTDTSPTGLFLDFQTAALASVFKVDRYGVPTINVTAQTGVAERIATFGVSDSATTFSLDNGTANASQFNPTFNGVMEQGVDGVPIGFFATKGVDSTNNPGFVFLYRHNTGSGNTDLSATVAGVEFRNRATSGMYFTGGYNLQLLGGSTSPSLAANAADKVSMAGVDNGAGNREWQCQPESGGALAYGSDTLRFVKSATQESDTILKSVNTTDGTQTTLATIAITSGYTYLIESRVTARRTGGSSGTADDGASYVRRGTYTTKSSTVTLMGSVQTLGTDAEDQAGWDVTLSISSTNVLVRVTGAANNNVTWLAETSVLKVAS